MLETKYIPQENADVIISILNKAQRINKLVKFKVIDDESGGVLYYGDNPEKAVYEMDGVDCNFGVNCVEDLGYDHDNKIVGWFFFTPYEEVDCVVCDHTDNEFCKQCLEDDEEKHIDKQVRIIRHYDNIAEKYTNAYNNGLITFDELFEVLDKLHTQFHNDLDNETITDWEEYYSGEENW